MIGIPAEDPIFSDIPASEAAGLIVRYAPGSAGCPNSPAGISVPGELRHPDPREPHGAQDRGRRRERDLSLPAHRAGAGCSIAFNGTYLMKWDQKSIGQATQQLAGQLRRRRRGDGDRQRRDRRLPALEAQRDHHAATSARGSSRSTSSSSAHYPTRTSARDGRDVQRLGTQRRVHGLQELHPHRSA